MDRLLGMKVWIILDHVEVDDLIQCLISFALTGWFKNLFLITHSFFKGFYYHIITKKPQQLKHERRTILYRAYTDIKF